MPRQNRRVVITGIGPIAPAGLGIDALWAALLEGRVGVAPCATFDAAGFACPFVAQLPADRFDEVAAKVNAFPEVAHNYARDHALNMWFVVAAETPERARAVCDEIAAATGLPVLPLPKLHEFHLDLRLVA